MSEGGREPALGAEDTLDKGRGSTPRPASGGPGDVAQWRRGAQLASPRSDASPAQDGRSRGGTPAGGGGGTPWDSPRGGLLSGARGDEPGLPGTPKRGPPARPPPPLPADFNLASPGTSSPAADAADGVSGGDGGIGENCAVGAEGSAAGGDGAVPGADALRGVYASLHGGYDEARKWRGQEDVAIILPAKTQRVRLQNPSPTIQTLSLILLTLCPQSGIGCCKLAKRS